MKKTVILSIVTTILVSLANAQNVNIPDPILKNYLVNHWYNPGGIAAPTVFLDANNDGEIQYSEAASYTSDPVNGSFNMGGLGISDLTGIEAFTSIKQIFVNNNQLTSININGCLALETLNCSGNPLTTLSINNPSLKKIDAYGCSSLTSVNVSGNNTLIEFNCHNNPNLTSFNLTGLTLEKLNISNNPLLTSFPPVNYPALTRLYIDNCGLTSLDLSNYSSLQYLTCNGNQLSSLNLANGNPQSFIQIDASGNPNLTCITVDNVYIANYLWGGGNPYIFDSWSSFNTNCTTGPCLVNIPDANFKAALVANTAINTNANNEIECTEAIAYTGVINVDNIVIADLTGIEAFINITSLSSNNNQVGTGFTTFLDTLDVSNFTSLTSISCTGNVGFKYLNASGCVALTSVDVSTGLTAGVSVDLNGCTSLTGLSLNNKNLNTLNLNGCTALSTLDCSNNQLTTLDVSSNLNLTTLNCSNNQLSSLNTLNNNSLTNLNCSNNQLTYLFVALNNALATLNCSNNNITYLDFNNNANLTTLDCSYNSLSSISVNNNPILTSMDCSHNNLPVLTVNADTALVTLNCSYNQLAVLDVSNNHQLQSLKCDYNQLPTINISNNTALQTLSCSGNNLPQISLINNLDLRVLNCSYNQLTNLNLNTNTELLELDCSHNQLTALHLQNDTLLYKINCTDNSLTHLDVSNTYMLMLSCDNNNLQSLNLANGHNTSALTITAANNPNLTCVKVDNAAYSTVNWTGGSFIFDAGVSFSADCTVGVNELETKNITVYPNPTVGKVYFSEKTNVQITNTVGQTILIKKNVTSVDLTEQPEGLYFISLIDENGKIILYSKIIKE